MATSPTGPAAESSTDFYRFDVERAVMAAQGLTPTQTLVLLTMLTYTGPRRPTCYASQVKLAKQTHLSRSTLAKAIAELQAAGVLVREQQRQRTNGGDGPVEFSFNLPALAKLAGQKRAASKRGGLRPGDEPICPKCGTPSKRIDLLYGCAIVGVQDPGLYDLPPKMRPMSCERCDLRWLTTSDTAKHLHAVKAGKVQTTHPARGPGHGVCRLAVLDSDFFTLADWQVI